MEAIKIAAAHIGSMAEMARQLGVSKQSVSFWRDGLRTIPADKCPDIERCTGGLVTCEQLRPDVNWAYLRGTNCPPAVMTSPAIELEPLPTRQQPGITPVSDRRQAGG